MNRNTYERIERATKILTYLPLPAGIGTAIVTRSALWAVVVLVATVLAYLLIYNSLVRGTLKSAMLKEEAAAQTADRSDKSN
jgi:hypothetical protein